MPAEPRANTALPAGLKRLLLAQFLQALADNATLALMLAWLVLDGTDSWWGAALKWSFTLAYVALAPWLLSWVDKGDKTRLLSALALLKTLAVLAILAGAPAWMGFVLMGSAAALYAPAKYGWVTQQVQAGWLVRATAWLEGSMVIAIMLGLAAAGAWVQSPNDAAADHVRLGLWLCVVVYLGSVLMHLTVPPCPASTQVNPGQPHAWRALLSDITALWSDRSIRVAMAMTSLMWGMAAVLQFAVIDWGQTHLGLSLGTSFYLQALVGLGVVGGALVATRWRLHQIHRLWPLSWWLAASLCALSLVQQVWLGALLLLITGVCAGLLTVPFNALLQHRGQRIRSAGRCMVVQGASENLSVLVMLGAYPWLREGMPSVDPLLWGMAALLVLAAHGLVGRRSWPRWPA